VALLLALALVACSGEPVAVAAAQGTADTPPGDTASAPSRPPPACTAEAGLERTRAQPLDAILFKGTTATHADDVDLVALMDYGDGSGPQELPLMVSSAPRQGWRFVAPVNPMAPFQESRATIRLRADGAPCGEWSLTLLPLERAPGTLAELAAQVDGTLTGLAALLGYPRDELLRRPWSALPPEARALRVLLEAFDGEGHEGSAMAHFRRAQPGLDTPGAEMMDALVARSMAVGKALDLRHELGAAASGVTAGNRFLPRPTPGVLAWLGIADAHAAGPSPFERPDAATLGRWMDMQLVAEIAATSTEAQSYLDGAKLLTTLGGIVPGALAKRHPGFTTLKGYYAALGGLIAAQDLSVDMLRHVLPGSFAEMELVLAGASYLEDAEDLDGRWAATVTATSRDWHADQHVASMLLSIGGGRAREAVMEKAGAEKLLRSMATHPLIEEMLDATQDLLAGPLLEEVLGAEGRDGLLRVPGRIFGPVDISEEAFSERELLHGSGQVVALTGHNDYRAVGTGTAHLTVRVRSERFGQQSILRTGAIDVLAIAVSVQPGSSTVQPGDTLVFNAEVDNANDRSVHWEVDPVHVHGVSVVPGPPREPSRLRVTFSENIDHYPVVVTATAMSRGGLRATGLPERQGHASANLETVTIKPVDACVETGESRQFTVDWGRHQGPGAPPVPRWSAGRGRIGDSGLYGAPSVPGADSVEGADRSDPGRRATTGVQVLDDCGCRFTLTGAMGRHDGDLAATQLAPGIFNLGSDRPGVATVSVMVGLPVSGPGAYPMAGYREEGSRITVTADEQIWTSVGGQLDITGLGPDSATGRFSGPMADTRDIAAHERDPAGNPLRTSPATLAFEVRRNPGQSFVAGLWSCGPPED